MTIDSKSNDIVLSMNDMQKALSYYLSEKFNIEVDPKNVFAPTNATISNWKTKSGE